MKEKTKETTVKAVNKKCTIVNKKDTKKRKKLGAEIKIEFFLVWG